MKNKEILFDFDGTIANTVDSVIRYLQENEIGLDIPELTDELVEEVRSMTPQQIMKELQMSKLQLIKFIREYQKFLLENISHLDVIKGMPEVIRQIRKDHTVGILSSNNEEVIKKFLIHYDMDLFEYMETGATLWKKDKKLKKALKKRDLNPEEVIYVGDEVKDYEAANRVGMKVISVAWGYNTKEMLEAVNPNGVATKPTEINDLINTF